MMETKAELLKRYSDLTKYNFLQAEQLKIGINAGLSEELIRMFADPKLHWAQMSEIRRAIQNEFPIEAIKLFANPSFNDRQMMQLNLALEHGMGEDMEAFRILTDSNLHSSQIMALRMCLERDVPVHEVRKMAESRMSMQDILKEKEKMDVSIHTKPLDGMIADCQNRMMKSVLQENRFEKNNDISR